MDTIPAYIAYEIAFVSALAGGAITYLTRSAVSRYRGARARQLPDNQFAVVCPVCEHRNLCSKGRVRERLEDEKPIIGCDKCNASLIGPYMNHPFVVKARREFSTLVQHNATMRAILEEPHHPVRQSDEDAIKAEKDKAVSGKAGNALMIYPHKRTGSSDTGSDDSGL